MDMKETVDLMLSEDRKERLKAEYWQTRIGKIDKFASSKSVIVNTAIN